MKFRYICFAAFVLLLACEKNQLRITETDPTTDKSFLKIVYISNASRNVNVQLKINDQRVSNVFTYPFAFPGGGVNINPTTNTNEYLTVDPGNVTLRLSIPASGTANDSVELFSSNLSLNPNEFQTLVITDTLPGITSFVIRDDYGLRPDSSFIKFRLVHGSPNMGAVDVYRNQTLLLDSVLYSSASSYIVTRFGATDTIRVRSADSSATSTVLATRNFSFANQRVYNLILRGYRGAGGTRAPNLSSTLVY